MKTFVVYIDERICKGCDLCVFYCPKGVLKLSTKMNQKGYSIAEVVNLPACTGCGLCEIGCPDFAIHVAEDPSDKA